MNDDAEPRFTFKKCVLSNAQSKIILTDEEDEQDKSLSFQWEEERGYLNGAFESINEAVRDKLPQLILRLYEIRGITQGANDYASAFVVIENLENKNQNRIEVGYGVDQSVIHAAVRAYISAINKLLRRLGEPETSPYGCNERR